MKTLVYSKQAEEVGWTLFCGGASFALPKERVEVVSFTQHCAFTHIEALSNRLQMEKPACQLEV